MELTLKTLLGASQALAELADTRGLPSVVAYRIARNVKAIDKELEVYNEQRKKLLEEKANKDENGEPIMKDGPNGAYYDIPNDLMEEFNKELEELKDETVDIDIKKVTLAEIDNAQLSAFQLNALEYMIDFEEEEAQ